MLFIYLLSLCLSLSNSNLPPFNFFFFFFQISIFWILSLWSTLLFALHSRLLHAVALQSFFFFIFFFFIRWSMNFNYFKFKLKWRVVVFLWSSFAWKEGFFSFFSFPPQTRTPRFLPFLLLLFLLSFSCSFSFLFFSFLFFILLPLFPLPPSSPNPFLPPFLHSFLDKHQLKKNPNISLRVQWCASSSLAHKLCYCCFYLKKRKLFISWLVYLLCFAAPFFFFLSFFSFLVGVFHDFFSLTCFPCIIPIWFFLLLL